MGQVVKPERFRSELADVVALTICCDDCGRERRWSRDTIAAVERSGVTTLGRLASRLRCTLCRERGGAMRNVTLHPTWRGERRLQAAE